MSFRPRLALLAAFIGLLLASQGASAGENGWKLEDKRDGIAIYSHPHTGSGLKEFESVGVIAAAPLTVFQILCNAADFPKFMPYSKEVRILQRTDDSVVAYHRLDLPLIDDRDYVLRSRHSITLSAAGPVYHIRWKPAVGIGPSPIPGVQRVTTCEGSWLLEPIATGGTRATYWIYSDTGGAIPAFLANSGSRTAIRKVFAAIRQRVHDPKYSGAKG